MSTQVNDGSVAGTTPVSSHISSPLPVVAPAATRAAAAAAPATPHLDGVVAAPGGATVARPAGRSRVRRLLIPVVAVVAIIAAAVAFNVYWEGAHYVSTDNAQVSGQLVPVGAMNAGRVIGVNVTLGAAVRKGDVLAEVALPSQVGMGQSGTPKLGFLGAADTRVEVPSPIDGVVVAVPGAVGATVAQGQPLVTLVDPTQSFVNANIDETKVGRVKVGQTVEVKVDTLGETVPGRVEAVTPAAAGVFSLLPSQGSAGNFTKVTQLVPVRIALNLGNRPALLGTSVEVKIRVQ